MCRGVFGVVPLLRPLQTNNRCCSTIAHHSYNNKKVSLRGHRIYHSFRYNSKSPPVTKSFALRTVNTTNTRTITTTRTIPNIPLLRQTTSVFDHYHHHRDQSCLIGSTIARRAISTTNNKDNNNDDNDNVLSDNATTDRPSWNDEWKRIGLGAQIIPNHDDESTKNNNNNNASSPPPHNKPPSTIMTNLLFVQTGFGVDQHGDRTKDGATKAAVRAVRNAIEFNSIPGVIEAVPGGRSNMLIRVLLGVPPLASRPPSPPPSTTFDDGDDGTNGGDVGLSKKKSAIIEQQQQPMHVDLKHVAKVLPYGNLLPIQIELGGLAFPTGRIVHELGDRDDVAVCVAACVSIGYDNGEREEEEDDIVLEGDGTHKTYDTRDGF